jgi:hypothetical protein
MDAALLLSLAGLALVDSTSIGTLFIPVWLLLAPGRVRVGRILVYLATIAGFYFAVGLLITLAADEVARAVDGVDARVGLWVQLVVGVGLFAASFLFGGKRKDGAGRVGRWRDRATGGDASAGWLIGLALLAALAEVATMLPYLGAIGLMTAADLSLGATAAVLAGYCVVMVVPAVVLLAGRVAASSLVEPLLHRLNKWVTEKAGSTTGWILGIAGFLIAGDAAGRLF